MADNADNPDESSPPAPATGAPARPPATAHDEVRQPDAMAADNASGTGDGEPPKEDGDEEASPSERRYRRRVGVLLALLAVLGAWINILQGNAATNEANAARETTRQAVEAQSETLTALVGFGLTDGIDVEVAALGRRPAFAGVGSPIGASDPLRSSLDPAAQEERLAEAEAQVEERASFDTSEEFLALQIRARRAGLNRAALTEERITWNARASQYETVTTVLAVAIFLVGFSLVIARSIRPPVLVPGVALAVFCFGWAVQIYNKPIPRTPDPAIDAVATGDALVSVGREGESIEAFDLAVDADDDYAEAYEGRALASFLLANPDFVTDLSVVDLSAPAVEQAVSDIERALELGGDDNVVTLTLAGVLAVADGDLERAEEALLRASELNPRAPGVQLLLADIKLARGDEAAAREGFRQAFQLLDPEVATEQTRRVAAQAYTMLGWIIDSTPSAAEAAEAFRNQVVAGETALALDEELSGEIPAEAALVLDELAFVNGGLDVSVGIDGLSDDDAVTYLVYARTAEGAPWAQPTDLAYFGPPVTIDFTGVDWPLRCFPVELRVDAYVNGAFLDSETRPGVAPNCTA